MLQFIGMMVAGLICNKAHSPRICPVECIIVFKLYKRQLQWTTTVRKRCKWIQPEKYDSIYVICQTQNHHLHRGFCNLVQTWGFLVYSHSWKQRLNALSEARLEYQENITLLRSTFNFEKMLYRFLSSLNLSPDLFISSWTQKKTRKQKKMCTNTDVGFYYHANVSVAYTLIY